jgi:hypothetical protein
VFRLRPAKAGASAEKAVRAQQTLAPVLGGEGKGEGG